VSLGRQSPLPSANPRKVIATVLVLFLLVGVAFLLRSA